MHLLIISSSMHCMLRWENDEQGDVLYPQVNARKARRDKILS